MSRRQALEQLAERLECGAVVLAQPMGDTSRRGMAETVMDILRRQMRAWFPFVISIRQPSGGGAAFKNP